jgi:hypothetical protein
MKYIKLLLIALVSIFIISCESADDAILTVEKTEINTSASKINPIKLLTDGLKLTKLVNGLLGGVLQMDTTFIDANGRLVTLNFKATFERGSFLGLKLITAIPDPNTGSIRFFPDMIFLRPVKLNLSYTGVDLDDLGLDPESQVDFVYQSSTGTIQNISNNGCGMDWSKGYIYVNEARLPHFSRYVFVRKSL